MVLDQYHDENSHMGMDKTYDAIGVKYYWPNMFKEVLEYIQGYVVCQARSLKTHKKNSPVRDRRATLSLCQSEYGHIRTISHFPV